MPMNVRKPRPTPRAKRGVNYAGLPLTLGTSSGTAILTPQVGAAAILASTLRRKP
jgi:hypothetical protein